MINYFYLKIIPLLKKYYLYIFAILLLTLISLVKIFSKETNSSLGEISSNSNIGSTLGVGTSYQSNVISTNGERVEVNLTEKEAYIDLSGAVINPGIYKVPLNARVGDVITMGGGLSKDASALWVSRNINFSKMVSDTQKIYIPFDWETYGDCSCLIDTLSLNIPNLPKSFMSKNSSSTNSSNYDENNDSTSSSSNEDSSSEDSNDLSSDDSSSTDNSPTNNNGNTSGDGETTSKINVNTATKDQLDSLSGIGPSYAQKIIDNRAYTNLTELISKSGVPKSTLEKIASEISF